MGREGGPSDKDMGVEPKETRVLSDAELIKGGARYKDERLEITPAQIETATKEMQKELAEKAIFDNIEADLSEIEELMEFASNDLKDDPYEPENAYRLLTGANTISIKIEKTLKDMLGKEREDYFDDLDKEIHMEKLQEQMSEQYKKIQDRYQDVKTRLQILTANVGRRMHNSYRQ